MKKALAATAAIALLTGITIAAAPAISADTCRESLLSSSMFGKKFNCPNGNSLTIKPNLSGTYDDSFSRYSGRDNYGNSYNCKYDSFRGTYKCSSSRW
jgi:hypothetical protein